MSQTRSKIAQVTNDVVLKPISKNANRLESFVRSIPSPVYWILSAAAFFAAVLWVKKHTVIQVSWGPTVGGKQSKGFGSGFIQLGSAKQLASVPKFNIEIGGGVPQIISKHATDASKDTISSVYDMRPMSAMEARAQSLL